MDHRPIMALFAGELRRARTAAGLTQEALGQEIRFSGSLVAAVEQCRRVPKLEFTVRCDEALKTDGLLARIREAANRDVLLPWFREWVRIEQSAAALRSYQPLVVPGLLQTEEYARALHRGASPLSADEMEQQVAARMERQAVLTKEKPAQFVGVLDEYLMRRPVGGPRVMRDQLLHLIEMGKRHNVHLHAVPVAAGAYAGLNGAFALATSHDGDDVGYLDNQLHGHIVDRPADVLSLRNTWESVRAEALSHGQTIQMITEAAQTWS